MTNFVMPLGMNWNVDYWQNLLNQHPCLTVQMLSWLNWNKLELNWSKAQEITSKIVWKVSQKEKMLKPLKAVLMSMALERVFQYTCMMSPNFDHSVHKTNYPNFCTREDK